MLLALTCFVQHSPCSESHCLAVWLLSLQQGPRLALKELMSAELMSAPCAITSMHFLTLVLAVEVIRAHIVLSRQPDLIAPLRRDAVVLQSTILDA